MTGRRRESAAAGDEGRREAFLPWLAACLLAAGAFAAVVAAPGHPAMGLLYLAPLVALGGPPHPRRSVALASGCLVLLVAGWAIAGGSGPGLLLERALVASGLAVVGARLAIDTRAAALAIHGQRELRARVVDLARSEGQLRRTFDHAAVGIGHLGPDGAWLLGNEQLCRLLGCSHGELLERPLVQTVHPQDRDRVRELLDCLFRDAGAERTVQVRLLSRGREPTWVDLSLRPEGSGTEAPEYLIVVVQDASAQKATKDERDAGRRALATARETFETAVQQRTSQLEDAVTNLERSNAELEQFAYVASHDLQEPLRMVASYTQLLARRYRGRLDEDADRFIDFAVEGSRRMQTLIQGLLAYARVQPAQGKVWVDANEVVQSAVANLAAAIREAGAILEQEPLPQVRADRVQLLQVFQNLLSNAVKFRAGSPPHIHVGAERVPEGWCFFVRDDGIGVDPEFSKRIFLIFQRLHGRNAFPGTGLGLALCKRIVEAHGGRIWVEPAQPQGSVFRFVLPQKESAPE